MRGSVHICVRIRVYAGIGVGIDIWYILVYTNIGGTMLVLIIALMF